MLLRDVKPEEAVQREEYLLQIYQSAGQAALYLVLTHGYCRYTTLARVGAKFDRKSELVETHRMHRTPQNDENPGLDGRQILGIMNPAVEALDIGDNLTRIVLVKARVLVEHREFTREIRDKTLREASEKAAREMDESASKKKRRN